MFDVLERELTDAHCASDWTIRIGVTPLSADRDVPLAVAQIVHKKERSQCLTGKRPVTSSEPETVAEQIRMLVRGMVPVAEAFLKGFKVKK